MAGSVHNHHIAHSNASQSQNRDDVSSESSHDSGRLREHGREEWPASSSTTSSSSNIHHGFDATGAAARGANLSRRASTHASSSGVPRLRRRTLNGTETRPELIEIIADMHEEMRGMARELHDATSDQQDPAARQRAQLRNQERLQRRTARMEDRRFEQQMRKMDQEKERLQRQEEFEEFKDGHEQRMEERKINNMLDKEETQEIEMAVGLSVEAGSKALQIINRGL